MQGLIEVSQLAAIPDGSLGHLFQHSKNDDLQRMLSNQDAVLLPFAKLGSNIHVFFIFIHTLYCESEEGNH